MKYFRLGKSGLKVSALGLGTNSFGGRADEKTSIEIIHTAIENGVTFIDTANIYTQTESERIIGLALEGKRHEVVLATKAGLVKGEGPNQRGSSRYHLMRELEDSLKRLRTDYVDLYQIHTFDPETPLEETMGALAQAVASGKALYAGLSNYDGETMKKAAAILDEMHCPFIINQNRYSIFDRTIEKNGLKDAAAETGKGIIAFSPLAQGLLTNRYLNGIPADSRIRTDGRFLHAETLTEERLQQIRNLNGIAAGRGQTLAEMALSWVLKDGAVTSVLIGASKPEQVLDNIKAIENTQFTEEELKKIDSVSM